jgi:6-phosphogluconolactonase
MGGFLSVNAVISGTVNSPGIPFSNVATSGIFKTPNDGVGFALTGRQYFAFDKNKFALGYKSPPTGVLTPGSGSPYATGLTPTNVTATLDSRFVYISNQASNNLTAYALNPLTGALTAIAGSPFATGTNPARNVVSPNGMFLLVINPTSSDISVFSRNAVTGVLTPVAGSPFSFANLGGMFDCTISNDGRQLLVTRSNLLHSIRIFDINQTTGALTENANSPVATTIDMGNIIISPDGLHVFAMASTNTIYVYKRNTTTGALTLLGTKALVPDCFEMKMTPDGTQLLVANITLNNITVYNFNPSTGTLLISGAAVSTGGAPTQIFIQPDGTFVYVTNFNDNTVSSYSRDLITGILTPVPGSPFTSGAITSAPTGISGTPDGVFVLVTNENTNTLTVFQTNPVLSFELLTGVFNPTNTLTTGVVNVNGLLTVLGVPLGSATWGSIGGVIATQADLVAYVTAQIAAAQLGLLNDRGNYDASTNLYPAMGGSGGGGAILKGDVWYISVAGTLGTTLASIGDTVRALVDTPGQTAGNWDILRVDSNIFPTDIIVAGVTVGHGAGAPTNTAFGSNVLSNAAAGSGNTAIGAYCQQNNIGGMNNTAIAENALAALTLGSANVAVGLLALSALDIGNSNVSIGNGSLGIATSASDNVALGFLAGGAVTTGTNNVIIGSHAGAAIDPGSYTLIIDSTGTGTATPLIGGSFDPGGGLLGYVKINGGLHLEIKTVAAAYPATDGDYTLRCDATAAPFSVTLQAVPLHGDIKNIKKIDGSVNAVTIDGNGNNIDGAATQIIYGQYISYTIQYDSSSGTWNII